MMRNEIDTVKLSKLNIVPDNEATAKFEISRYLEKYESISPTGANFMLLDPHKKIYYTVPVGDIDFVMRNLMTCYDKQVMNYMYEFPDICRTSDDKDEPVSGLYFDFKFESKDKNPIPFEKVVSRFIRVLFKDIIQECLIIPKERITHYCFFLSSIPVFDARTQLFLSKFRVIVPTIMTTPKVRFGIFDRLYNLQCLRDIFKQILGVPFRECFERSMRLSPIPLIGSCDIELGEPLKYDNQVISVDVDGTNEEVSLDSTGQLRHNMTNGDAYSTMISSNTIPNIIYAASINYQPPNGMIIKKPYYATALFEKKIDHYLMHDKKREYQEEYDKARATFITQMADKVANGDHQKTTYTQIYDWLKMLSDDRFSTLEKWQEVLRCLAFNGDYYRCIAVIVTRERAKGFADLELLHDSWEEAKDTKYHKKYTPGAIKHWANCDAYQKVSNYTKALVQKKMVDDIVRPFHNGKLDHDNFARYLQIMLKNEFITVDSADKGVQCAWYEFVTDQSTDVKKGQMYKWRQVGSEPDRLYKSIGEDMANIAESVYWELKHLYQYFTNGSTKDEFRSKYLAKLIKRFEDQNAALYRFTFKQKVIKASSRMFKNNTFMENLDKVENILGVGNGVLEFQGADVIFIDHYHNYPVSLYTDTNYVPYDPANEYVITMMKVLKSLVPEDEEDALHFLLYYFSTSLDWLCKESLFFIIHGGGCHAIDTPIRMFDGSVKKVQDVEVGDSIMGDDNTPRVVQELFRGQDDMVEIVPIKGEPFSVNKNHVLSLKFTNTARVEKRNDGSYKDCSKYRAVWHVLNGSDEPIKQSKTFATESLAREYISQMPAINLNFIKKGDIIDIKVVDLMKWSPWWLRKSNVSLYKSEGVAYEEKRVAIDPYMLGYWLGDGHSRGPSITTEDLEIVEAFKELLDDSFELRVEDKAGNAKTYRIVDTVAHKSNRLLDHMRDYDLIMNKHIPFDYKVGSTEQRLRLLAGILDSDGHYQSSMKQYELTLKSEKLFDDCVELVQSLGFACYKAKISKTCTNGANGPVVGTYFRMQIYGKGLETIPCKLERKKASPRIKAKNALLNSFQIRPIGVGNYYGFELDGNHRYLTGDHYVHHNSNGKSVIMDLFNRMLGNSYAKKLPLSFITDLTTEKSGAANPAIMDLEYARMATYSESNKNEKVNISKIKEVTGGELIAGRQLYEGQKNFRVNCNHIVTTNHCFSLQTTEHAVWRRFISYKFKIRFVPSNPVPGTYDRLGDRILVEKIKSDKRYHEAFLSILVHYRTMLYRKYNGNILHVPHPTIQRETEEYRISQDIYQKFIMQNLYYSENVEPQSLNVLVSNFRTYCSVESSQVINESTEYLISTFKNSSALQKHIIDNGGILLLRNVYSLEPHGSIAPNSMLFSEWLKQEQESE